MTGCKRGISLLGGLDHGTKHHKVLCQISWENCKMNKKKYISQCKIANNWGISPSTMHNIVKRFRESSKISVHIGKGRTPQLNVCDLRALRWHCTKNSHAAVLNITAWAQEYHCRLNNSAAASWNATWISIYKRRNLRINSTLVSSQGPNSSQIFKKTANVCSAQMTEMSTFQLVFRGKLVSASDVTPTDRWLNVWAHISQASKNYSQEHCFN